MSSESIYSKELFDLAYGTRGPEAYAGLLSEVILYGKPGPILDLGAGLGLFTELAYRWGLDVTGLEGSSFAVKEAHSRADSIKMLEGDLADPLPFDDQTVANVVLYQVAEHLDREAFQDILLECHRVLEQNGKIFVASPSRRNMKENSEPTHINLMLPSELKKSLETVGFVVTHQPNGGLWFAPTSGARVGYVLSKILLRLLPHDWISATANAIAAKRR